MIQTAAKKLLKKPHILHGYREKVRNHTSVCPYQHSNWSYVRFYWSNTSFSCWKCKDIVHFHPYAWKMEVSYLGHINVSRPWRSSLEVITSTSIASDWFSTTINNLQDSAQYSDTAFWLYTSGINSIYDNMYKWLEWGMQIVPSVTHFDMLIVLFTDDITKIFYILNYTW